MFEWITYFSEIEGDEPEYEKYLVINANIDREILSRSERVEEVSRLTDDACSIFSQMLDSIAEYARGDVNDPPVLLPELGNYDPADEAIDGVIEPIREMMRIQYDEDKEKLGIMYAIGRYIPAKPDTIDAIQSRLDEVAASICNSLDQVENIPPNDSKKDDYCYIQ